MKKILTLIGLMVAITFSTGCPKLWNDLTTVPEQRRDTLSITGDGNSVTTGSEQPPPEPTPTPEPQANPNQAGFGFIQILIVVLIMLSGSGCAFSTQGPAHLSMSLTASLYNRGGTVGNDQAHSDAAGAATGADWIETEGGGRMDTDTDVNSSAETTRTETTTEEPAKAKEGKGSEEDETEEKPSESLVVGDSTFEPLDQDPTAEEVNADKESYLNFAGKWYRKVKETVPES